MPNKKEYNLIEAIETIGKTMDPDVDIVTVKLVGPAKSPIVRVYIDYPGGVNFDVLAQTQSWISSLLDELDPFSGSYTLEVSSPGIDRPLRKPKHFCDNVGKMAKVKTSEKIDGRGAFTGTIASADDNCFTLILDEGKQGDEPQVNITYDMVTSANLKGEI